MIWTKTRATALTLGVIITLGLVIWLTSKPFAPRPLTREAKTVATIRRIQQDNPGLPEAQIQAKALIMTAMMVQKKIPGANSWCDTLNIDRQLWPITPTNTIFALNTPAAGIVYARGIPGDLVVFFQTPAPGWNQAGGRELLATNDTGAAVALMDGRALIVSAAEAARLRWQP